MNAYLMMLAIADQVAAANSSAGDTGESRVPVLLLLAFLCYIIRRNRLRRDS